MQAMITYQQHLDQALFALVQHARYTLRLRPLDARRADTRRRLWADLAADSAETPAQVAVAAIVRDADPSAWYDLSLWYGSERMQDAAQTYRRAFDAHRVGSCHAPPSAYTMDWRTARNDDPRAVLA